MKTVFNKTVIGASHISSNKPCQDFSLSENTSDYSIIIVSDGHGSDTYVRSDVGSKLAATIAKTKTIEFLPTLYSLQELKSQSLFVCPKPETDSAKLYVHKSLVNPSEQLQQDIKYFESVIDKENVDRIIRSLFSTIHEEWLRMIEEDYNLHPFTEMEKQKLGKNNIVKAYGCTLICCVVTNEFYFAYQIGDGKCYISSTENEWTQPIPWDCNCFLNITTSLCLENKPISNLFRYAFNSKDSLPAVIFIGSDGVDGCYENEKVLELDYASIVEASVKTPDIHLFENVDLSDFLTQKSQTGSKDDMSLCGIIETENIGMWLELNQLKKSVYIEETKGAKIKKEIARIEQIISRQEERITELKKKKAQNENTISTNIANIKVLEEKLRKIKESTTGLEKDNLIIEQELQPLLVKKQENVSKLEEEKKQYESWKNEAKISVSRLREERDEILKNINGSIQNISIQDLVKTIIDSDEICFAKLGGSDSESYTYRVVDSLISYESVGAFVQSALNQSSFDELKKQLLTIDWQSYSQKEIDSDKYCYITFMCQAKPLVSFFFFLEEEDTIKQMFAEKLKLQQGFVSV